MSKEISYFDPELEILADDIPQLNPTNPYHYVDATSHMNWPFNKETNSIKYVFGAKGRQGYLQFEVDFTGNLKLRLKESVQICLKGVRVVSRPSAKPPSLPFKLEFPDGFVVKVGDRVVDTFPDEPPPIVVPSWFTSQLPPESDPPSPQPSVTSELENPSSGYHLELLPHAGTLIDKGSRRERSQSVIPTQSSVTVDAPISLCQVSHKLPTTESRISTKRPRDSVEDSFISVIDQQLEPPSGDSVVPDSMRVTSQTDFSKGDSGGQRPKKKRRRKDRKSHTEPKRNPALDMVAGFQSNLAGPFTPLAEILKVGTKFALIAVVRGISLPRSTKNGDWSVSVEVFDPSTTEASPFVANLFLSDSLKDCIPTVKAGDIVMLVKLVAVRFKDQVRGTGYPDTFQWAGYSPSQQVHFHSTHRTFSDLEHCPFFKPGPEELEYARQLAEWWKALQELAQTKPDGIPTLMATPRGRSLITLSEAKPDVFFNSIVEILFKITPGDQSAEIFVTDYTIHPQFYPRQLREDTKHAKQEQINVYGRRVLKIMLWGSIQIEHARELETPGYYYIDNLRVKFDSKGNLEGTLQDDKRKIDKLRKDDPMLEDLLKRKAEYMEHPPSPELNKSQDNLGRGQDSNLHTAGDLLPSSTVLTSKQVQPTKQGAPLTRLLYYNIVQVPIQQVLTYTQCPEIFRIRARIVAFEPYNLARFTCGFCTKCKTDFLPNSTACHECGDFEGEHVGYEYRFRFCVEEECTDLASTRQAYRASLVLDVSGKEAEMFLSGLPAQDFHRVENARKLRNRLAPILGNLEAYQCDMAAGNSTKALVRGGYFDMLIQSYRSKIKSEGSVENKRYKLWGTELLPKASK